MDLPATLNSERYRGQTYRVSDSLAVAIDGELRKKSVDNERNSITAVLTYPCTDLAGDIVDPAGCDFAEHELTGGPVDVEHSRTREFGNLIVAKSVHPDGTYAVKYRTLTLPDQRKAKLPVGTSYFDRNNRASMQVFAMVERDILPGVSLEFKALSGRPIGPSPLENRPAYEFSRVAVVRYSHCATPVNPGALTVTKALDSLMPVIQTGKLGSEALDPRLLGVLKKSVRAYTPRIQVRGGFVEKAAMDELFGPDDTDPNATPDVPMEDPAPDAAAPANGPPTAAAAYEAAQAIKDAIEAAKQKLQASEHIKGRDQILKELDKLEATTVEKLLAIGDQVTADVGGEKPMGDEEADTDDIEPDATEPDEDDDSDKPLMKAFKEPKRLWIRKSLLKRFTKSEIDAAAYDPEPPAPVATEPQDSPEDLKRLERARRKYQKTERIFG